MYLPEGLKIDTDENREYTSSISGLEAARANGIILEKPKTIEEAKANLAIAKDHFNYAEGKFFYIANEELTVAEMRLNMALHKARLLAPEASK